MGKRPRRLKKAPLFLGDPLAVSGLRVILCERKYAELVILGDAGGLQTGARRYY